MRQRSGIIRAGVVQTELLDRLRRRYGKYALVAGVAKRARDLKERIRSPLEASGGGLVNRAIDEIAEGKVKILGGEPGEESE